MVSSNKLQISVSPGTGVLLVTVVDYTDFPLQQPPIQGATVTVGGASAVTGPDGVAQFSVQPGTYTVTASKQGYQSSSDSLTIPAGTSSGVTLGLIQQPAAVSLYLRVNGASGPLSGASVSASSGQSATTGSDGSATLVGVPSSAITVTVSAQGYLDYSFQVAASPAVSSPSSPLTLTLEVSTHSNVVGYYKTDGTVYYYPSTVDDTTANQLEDKYAQPSLTPDSSGHAFFYEVNKPVGSPAP